MPWSVQAVPVLIAGNTIINPNGMFVYNASGPGAGNLSFTVANAGTTTDSFGNTVIDGGVGGACAYNGAAAAFLGNASIEFQTTAGAIAGGFGGQIFENINGQLQLNSGGTSVADTQGQIILGSAGVGTGKTRFDVFAQRSSFNGSGFPSLGTAPNDSNSGSTWVAGERAFMNNNWVAYMNNIDSALEAMFLG